MTLSCQAAGLPAACRAAPVFTLEEGMQKPATVPVHFNLRRKLSCGPRLRACVVGALALQHQGVWLQHLCRSAGVVLSIDGEDGMWELRRREDSHGPQSPACKTCTPHSRGHRQWLLAQCCGQPRWCSQQATALPRRWHQRLNRMAGPSWSEAPWHRSLCRSMTSSITQPAAALLQHWRQR